MRDHLIGLVVAGLVLAVSYIGIEYLAGRDLVAQEPEDLRTTQELIEVLDTKESTEEERLSALIQLGKSKDDLDIVVPLLCKWNMAGKSVYSQACSMALAEIGDDAVEHVKPFFESKFETNEYDQIKNLREIRSDRSVGCAAVQALGDRCSDCLPEIQRMVQHEEKSLRFCGLFALRGMDQGAAESLDMVIVCLKDEDFNNQCQACRIVERLGPKAAKAEPVLQELLVKGNPSVRGWAAICLGAIGPSPSKTDNASLLAKNLKNASPVEISRILKGLALIGPDAKHVADQVRSQLENWDRDVQANAAFALWKIDNDIDLACSTIKSLLTQEGYEQDGLEMAMKMGPDAECLITQIRSRATDEDALTRERVALALGAIGKSAKQAIPTLQTMLKDEDPIVRKVAEDAIAKINVE
ncbi:MAG: HEAT repeat domain-containing protein [Planctomycetota bacterium]